jgi:hypothetical protein
MTHPGIFIIGDSRNLIELRSSPYDSEAILQELLETHPNLLVGDQVDPAAPRRWLLIEREAGVPDETGVDRWSLDHLFVDQEGIPTLVEVKRSNDTRIRREVVGQMLDYASNCVVYWPAERIRSRFEERCRDEQIDAATTLSVFLEGGDPEAFWNDVKRNLQAGILRMLFVADEIPPELRRVIEFLNMQMERAEVLGIEIRHYAGGNFRGFVPRVVGQTEQALQKKRTGSATPTRQWDIASFREELRSRFGASEMVVADRIVEWAQEHGGKLEGGYGTSSGSLFFDFGKAGEKLFLFALWTYGKVEIQFQGLARSQQFAADSVRDELRLRLNGIRGVAILADLMTKRPSIPYALLASESALAAFFDAMNWALTIGRASNAKPST